ncbi:MAG: hypothetical protein AAGH41_13340 [Pseudomonadota bacterium]
MTEGVHRVSARTAVVFAVLLAIGEAVRNWGDWQWWPWWVVDYVCAVLLLIGATLWFRSGDSALLAGGWAFTAGTFYMSAFSHIESIRQGAGDTYGPGGSLSETTLTAIIFLMLAVAIAGCISAIWPARSPE